MLRAVSFFARLVSALKAPSCSTECAFVEFNVDRGGGGVYVPCFDNLCYGVLPYFPRGLGGPD